MGNDTLVVTAFLNYIGANVITDFIVSYRSIGTNEWSESRHVPAQPGASTLEWRAVLTEKQFVQLKSMLELQVSILNDFSNTSIIYREHVGESDCYRNAAASYFKYYLAPGSGCHNV